MQTYNHKSPFMVCFSWCKVHHRFFFKNLMIAESSNRLDPSLTFLFLTYNTRSRRSGKIQGENEAAGPLMPDILVSPSPVC